MSRILLGVSGGIAAYKACELTRLLVKARARRVPLVTPGAERFVRAETFAALARRPAGEDLYLHLTRADLLVVAPCTANTLAKLAHGLSDNLLTEAALAHRGPVLVAPAMNPRMWAHPATRANAETLLARGVELVGPDEGETAEGEWGVGRMAEPAEIARRAEQLLAPGTPRRQARRSSPPAAPASRSTRPASSATARPGRMGVALAEEARRRGAEVVLLAANLAVPAPAGVETIPTPTAESMLDAALALADFDIALLAAAVADYRPAVAIAEKRTKSDETWTVELEPTADIARRLGEAKRPGQLLVTFGADLGEDGLERKRAMLETKNADLVVFNDVSRADIAFESADNEVVLVSRDGERRVAKAPKPTIAVAILDEVERLLAQMSEAYDLFQEGRAACGSGMTAQATVPLEKAKKLEPDKASIREALGIAYFRLRRWDEAEAEFRAVLELSPTDDYAHYALGRVLEKQGRDAEANGHYKLASSMRPAGRELRGPDPRARVAALARRRPARLRARGSRPAARSAPGSCVLLGVADGDEPQPPSGSPARSRGCGSSRATTASSTARCSTRAAPRSSSRSSR